MTETEYSIFYCRGAGQGSDFEDGVSRLCPNFEGNPFLTKIRLAFTLRKYNLRKVKKNSL